MCTLEDHLNQPKDPKRGLEREELKSDSGFGALNFGGRDGKNPLQGVARNRLI